MVSRFLFTLTVLTAVMFSFASVSHAQNGRQEYQKARDLFEAEEFTAALPFFEKAYQLSNKRPSTILGLAQCERALKKYDNAVVHFQEFLATNPAPEQAERVKETLRLTQIMLKSKPLPEPKKKAEAAPPKIVPPPEPQAVSKPEPSLWSAPWLWVTVGVVVVGGAVGAGFALAPQEDPYLGNTGIALQP